MYVSRSIGIRSLVLLICLVMVTASFWVWLLFWEPGSISDHLSVGRYLLYNEFLLVGISFGLGGARTAEGPHREFVAAVRRSCRQLALGLLAVFVVAFALQDTAASRWFFFSYIPCLFVILLFSNYLVPKWLGKWAFSGSRRERVALAGTPEQARQLKPWLDRKGLIGLHSVGVVSPPGFAALVNGHGAGHGHNSHSNGNGPSFPLLGDLNQVEEILQKSAITQLIVLDLSIGTEEVRRLAQLCEGAGVRLVALHDVNRYFNHTTTTFEDDGVRFISLREEPLESPANRIAKRALDLAVALPVVALVLPFSTLMVWILQRMQSPGPIFFKQARVGMKGIPFRMIKYRTMHMNHGPEDKQASTGDPRIYPAGRWLRKFSVDELPQFINVVKGDMSLVGPRPHLQAHEEIWTRIMRTYVVRRFIRPGITGWAQVNGFRGEIHTEADIRKRVEADIHYLENWSFSLDCMIIVKTIRGCVIPPESAY